VQQLLLRLRAASTAAAVAPTVVLTAYLLKPGLVTGGVHVYK